MYFCLKRFASIHHIIWIWFEWRHFPTGCVFKTKFLLLPHNNNKVGKQIRQSNYFFKWLLRNHAFAFADDNKWPKLLGRESPFCKFHSCALALRSVYLPFVRSAKELKKYASKNRRFTVFCKKFNCGWSNLDSHKSSSFAVAGALQVQKIPRSRILRVLFFNDSHRSKLS
jgi:hypothetical protein